MDISTAIRMNVADEVARQLGMTKPGELLLADRIREAMLRVDSVSAVTGLSRSTIYRLVADEKFPRPVKVETTTAWLLSEIEAWIAARRAERDAAA
jgi:prophage regulatory protein